MLVPSDISVSVSRRVCVCVMNSGSSGSSVAVVHVVGYMDPT